MTSSQDIALSIMQRAQGIVRCLEIYRNQTHPREQVELLGSLQAIKECLDDDWWAFLRRRREEAVAHAEAHVWRTFQRRLQEEATARPEASDDI